MGKNHKQEPELFAIAGNNYYIDLEELSQCIRIEKTESVDDILGENNEEELSSEEKEISAYSQIIDVAKWEVLKIMVESVLNENSVIDEAMGPSKLGEQLSIPFRISFNTLIKNKIIKEENGR
jgi:hypothetical protein